MARRIVSVHTGSSRITYGFVFRSIDQPGSQGIALDIAKKRVKVFVALDWKRLEPSLIEMAGPYRYVMRVPSIVCVVSEPAKKVRNLAFTSRLHNEVPMIPHDAIGKNSSGMKFQSLVENSEERFEIRSPFEKGQPSHSPIEDMVNVARWRGSCSAWHSDRMARSGEEVKKNELRPLCFSREAARSTRRVLVSIASCPRRSARGLHLWRQSGVWTLA